MKLLREVLKNEASYLLSSTIMFTSLFFILFILFMGKEIFIHYSDSKSMLLPKSMVFVKKDLADVNDVLEKNSISHDDVLLARVKNYEDLSVHSNINGAKSLPKNFTLLSFDIQHEETLILECGNLRQEVKLTALALKQHKNWVFKTDKLQNCPTKSRVKLITSLNEIELVLKRNNTYAKLLYKSDAKSDKDFYTYLIDFEERLFLKYFAYSKFFVHNGKELTQETQEHAKMLNSLYRIIFAKKKQKCMLNHEAYSFLTEYKKIPFTILPISSDYTKPMTVVDELALDIRNEIALFHSQLIVANLDSLPDVEYDATVIFFKNSTPSDELFDDALVIPREEFQTVKESASLEINATIYTATLVLFVLMLTLVSSFVSRSYKRYYDTFSLLIFYGFRLKIVTLLFTSLTLVSIAISYGLTLLLFSEVNKIFNLYYVDLIKLDFEYLYMFMFFLLSISFSYMDENKTQESIANKAKR